jgi:hypothetical protein
MGVDDGLFHDGGSPVPLAAGLTALLLAPVTVVAAMLAWKRHRETAPVTEVCTCNCCAYPGVPYHNLQYVHMLATSGSPTDGIVQDILRDGDAGFVGEDEEFNPGFSATVYRDDDGVLRAGWGHVLTTEEAKVHREGSVVDDQTIAMWFEQDQGTSLSDDVFVGRDWMEDDDDEVLDDSDEGLDDSDAWETEEEETDIEE